MAQAKRKTEWDAGRQTPAPAVDGAFAATSPARALQQLLEEQARLHVDEVRWSRRRSIALIVSLSATLWIALLTISHTAMVAAA